MAKTKGEYCVVKTGEDAFYDKWSKHSELVEQAKKKGFILVQDEDMIPFDKEEDAKEYVEKYNAQKNNREALRNIMYFKDKNNHKGFIGKAYLGVLNLFSKEANNAAEIASKRIGLLSAGGKRSKFPYEEEDTNNFYTVMYTYAYAQHFNHIYRKLLKEVTEDYVKDNGLTIASIGAGNFVDYWSLESALYMEAWGEEAISQIRYHAYEYNIWPVNLAKQIVAERKKDYPFRIPKEGIMLTIGNFFEIREKADVVFFPSSFNELIEQQTEKKKIANVLKENIKPQYIITTEHRSKDDEIKKIIYDYCKNAESFDQFHGEQTLQSVMPTWCGDNNITNASGRVLGVEEKLGEEEKKKITRFKPVTDLNRNMRHTSYKVVKQN